MFFNALLLNLANCFCCSSKITSLCESCDTVAASFVVH